VTCVYRTAVIERAARSGRKAGNGGSCGFGVRTDVTGALFVNKCCTSIILLDRILLSLGQLHTICRVGNRIHQQFSSHV
jgi:hypothetical protein